MKCPSKFPMEPCSQYRVSLKTKQYDEVEHLRLRNLKDLEKKNVKWRIRMNCLEDRLLQH